MDAGPSGAGLKGSCRNPQPTTCTLNYLRGQRLGLVAALRHHPPPEQRAVRVQQLHHGFRVLWPACVASEGGAGRVGRGPPEFLKGPGPSRQVQRGQARCGRAPLPHRWCAPSSGTAPPWRPGSRARPAEAWSTSARRTMEAGVGGRGMEGCICSGTVPRGSETAASPIGLRPRRSATPLLHPTHPCPCAPSERVPHPAPPSKPGARPSGTAVDARAAVPPRPARGRPALPPARRPPARQRCSCSAGCGPSPGPGTVCPSWNNFFGRGDAKKKGFEKGRGGRARRAHRRALDRGSKAPCPQPHRPSTRRGLDASGHPPQQVPCGRGLRHVQVACQHRV